MSQRTPTTVRPEPVEGRGVLAVRRSWFDKLTTNGNKAVGCFGDRR